jgi:predicted unusual protein kinase regulating ubiquinone biosynthesis (AarF/ABC1/UbiB family)
LGDGVSTPDQIILLDFGAVRDFPEDLLTLARTLTKASVLRDRETLVSSMKGFSFFDEMGIENKKKIAEVCLLAVEPFTKLQDAPKETVTADGKYIWAKSNLHTRVLMQATKSAANREFSVPPKELMFISRKFIGAYTFMTVIDAKIYAYDIIEPFLK